MGEENVFVQNYLDAYETMRKEAIEKIKNYGKVLDVYEEINKNIVKEKGYKSVNEITDDDRDEYYWDYFYNCVYEGKHNYLYCCRIAKVKYDEKENDVYVYLEDDDYGICEWFPHWDIGFDKDAIYMTILKYIE